jgi:hypothetical protein
MQERNKNRPRTADEWMDYISEFAHKSELGSPEHCAVNDFLNLQRLYNQFGEKSHDHLPDTSGEASLSQEHRESRDIQKIALLEHTIEQNKARIPGYSDAFVHLHISFQDLLGAAIKEAQSRFPNDVEKQNEDVRHIYDEALGYVFSDVFEKQNPNH